jgi:recombination protein RecR
MKSPETMVRLIEQLRKLPGVGPKTAGRLALYLIGMDSESVTGLAEAMIAAKQRMHACPRCFNLTDEQICGVCSDESREKNMICVVEGPEDVIALERMGEYNGLYHVLGGNISPMNGTGPDDVRLRELLERLKDGGIHEVILATDPDVEGEATALYIARLIGDSGIKVTRLARGLPVGGDLEYADEVTLARAMEGRRVL